MGGLQNQKKQSFREHVRDLRRSFLLCLLSLVATSTIGYLLYKPLFSIIVKPLHQQLYYTSPVGAFSAVFKISLMFGLLTSLPLIVLLIYRFVSPAFAPSLRKRSLLIILFSALLAAAGVSEAYYISLPATLHFLTNIAQEQLQPLIGAGDYLNFTFNYLVGFALLFQIPLIMLLINRVKPQRPRRLMNYERHTVVGSFAAAAVITPTPDPMNQTLVALPIILLYQFSVIMIWLINRKKFKLEDKAKAAANNRTRLPRASLVGVNLKPVAAAPTIVHSQAKFPRQGETFMDIIPAKQMRTVG
ncbi:MAG TPA: twin-arginine translocase subunit TatC [Candidatus Saccharimonadales bacterium]|nr:twin-arginine translocase subunit TatC [Candidatus Saccharimonadales bacterium]